MPILMSGNLELVKYWCYKGSLTTLLTDQRGRTVGHVPINLAPLFSHFLKRSFNKGTAEIIGEIVNHGAGYGLEVPCIYRPYGPKDYIKRTRAVPIVTQWT